MRKRLAGKMRLFLYSLYCSVLCILMTGDVWAAQKAASSSYYPPMAPEANPQQAETPQKKSTAPKKPASNKQQSVKKEPTQHYSIIRRQDSPEYEYQSAFLKQKLSTHKDIYLALDAEYVLLPLMRNHAGIFRGKRVLDVNTGMGLNGIFAAKLGAAKVVATDINPLAVTYATLNAQATGVDKIMEVRGAPDSSPQAYSALKRGEKFDIILACLPYVKKPNVPMSSDLGNDNGQLLMSFIDGLRDHLNKGGLAIVVYNSYFSQAFLKHYADMQGYRMRYHPSNRLANSELNMMLNAHLKDVLQARGLDMKKFGAMNMGRDIKYNKPFGLRPLFSNKDRDHNYYSGATLIGLP